MIGQLESALVFPQLSEGFQLSIINLGTSATTNYEPRTTNIIQHIARIPTFTSTPLTTRRSYCLHAYFALLDFSTTNGSPKQPQVPVRVGASIEAT